MKEEKKRTVQQNRALHLYCQLLSDALNDAGLDMKATLKPEIDIPWTPENVKNNLWRPIQKAMTGKESTTEIDTVDPSLVYEVLNKNIAEKFGIHIAWPSKLGRLLEYE
jgi:hypothetical protein